MTIISIAKKKKQDPLSKKYKDKIPGGKADRFTPKDFDLDQLKKGIKVEMEHTDDPGLALEIAMDHLTENDKYYDYLEKMERKFEHNSNDGLSTLASIAQELDELGQYKFADRLDDIIELSFLK